MEIMPPGNRAEASPRSGIGQRNLPHCAACRRKVLDFPAAATKTTGCHPMNTLPPRCAVVPVTLLLALAGCATPATDSAAPKAGVVVETKKVILTGSNIPITVPKNAIAHPAPPMTPVVILQPGETMPFMDHGGGPN
jgi:hypothetical protein